MIGYGDYTFCQFYRDCKQGNSCDRALTDKVIKKAVEWWGKENAPICTFANKPQCWECNDGRGEE